MIEDPRRHVLLAALKIRPSQSQVFKPLASGRPGFSQLMACAVLWRRFSRPIFLTIPRQRTAFMASCRIFCVLFKNTITGMPRADTCGSILRSFSSDTIVVTVQAKTIPGSDFAISAYRPLASRANGRANPKSERLSNG